MKMDNLDFLIIGATKSATTWLQRSLQADPAVFMPDPELHYFSREYHRGDAWYFAQFAGAAEDRLIGEKSNSYLESAEAAKRIARALPWARLVVQLRNPIDRAYSDYCMMYRRGEVGRDVERYLDPRRPQETRLLTAGLYHGQLSRYYDLFPAERILVTLFETIRTAPERQSAAVRIFLGLPDRAATFVEGKVKDKTTPMLSPMLRRLLRPMKPAVAPLRNTPYFRKVHAIFAAEIQYPPFPDRLRRQLRDFYSRDVEALGGLIGRDLSGWLDGAARSADAA